MTARSWVVITPARNEADRLPSLAASLARQKACPIAAWVVVDDGSQDATAAVAEAQALPFRTAVLRRGNSGGLAGGSDFAAFRAGVAHALELHPTAARIMKLDADVVLAPDYFEELSGVDSDDNGLIGGVIVGRHDLEHRHSVRGALKSYSRQAWAIADALPSALGFDVLDEVVIRRAGLAVVVVPTAHARVTRPTGTSEGPLRGRRRNGTMCRWVGYDPIYFVLKLCRYLGRPPIVVGSAAMLWGYVTAGRGPFSREVRAWLRDEQRARLRALAAHPIRFVRGSFARATDSATN